MITVKVEKECGCFKRSELENNINFESKDDALTCAINMSNKMNDEFCGKHEFSVAEDENNLIISMNMPTQSSSCCGGGCH